MNLVEATLDGGDCVFGQFRVPLDRQRRPARADGPVVLGVRPEAFEDADFASSSLPRLSVRLEVVEELGAEAHVFFRVDAKPAAAEVRAADDDEAALLVDGRAICTARVDPRTSARVGSELELAVDPSRFHFFEPVTGESLLGMTPALAEPAQAVVQGRAEWY